MSERKISYNPQAVKKSPLQVEEEPLKENKKGKKSKRRKKEKIERSTRSIRFEKRGIRSYLTIFFWTVFLFSLGMNIMNFTRFNYVLDLANKNLAQAEDSGQGVTETMNQSEAQFYSKNFIRLLFTIDETNRESRSEKLQSQLATNLNVMNFASQNSETKQNVSRIDLISSQIEKSGKDTLFEFTYEVTYETPDKSVTTQLKLETSMENGDFKVVNYPTYLNIQPSENGQSNTYAYDQSRYFTKGTEVDSAEKDSIEAFISDFFKLYVTNDPNLKLISNVQGINAESLNNLNVQNIVEKNGMYVVEGTYSFSYVENSELTSYFHVQIEKTTDSYFVKGLSNQ
nr:conjugal transfer protein [Enterococcus innesii]